MTKKLNILSIEFIFTISCLFILSFSSVEKNELCEKMSDVIAESEVSNSKSNFQQIFNGYDLSGWEGDERFWSVENGAIIGETTSETQTEINTFLIWKEDEPANFEIQFRYKFVIVGDEEYGNSGMQFRSERFDNEDFPQSDYAVRGYQADMAISDWITGIHYEEKGRGILARRGQNVLIDSKGKIHQNRFAKEEDLGGNITHTEWNDYYVYANGDTLRSYINGERMHEIIDQSPEAEEKGIVAFQLHAGPPMRVEIKDVEIKRLNYNDSNQ